MKKVSRKPNFSKEELSVLSDKVNEHKSVLFAKLSPLVTADRKNRIWEALARSVNAAAGGCSDRTAESVRKKWTDWSSSVKSKEVARRQAVRRTGGGDSEDIKDLTQVEEKVVHILGKVVTEGIPGATDTSSNNQEAPTPPQDKIDYDDDYSQQAQVEEDDSDLMSVDSVESVGGSGIRSQSVSPSCSQTASKANKIRPPHQKVNLTVDTDKQSLDIVKIERERLEVEKMKLEVDRERLEVEREMLDVLKKQLLVMSQPAAGSSTGEQYTAADSCKAIQDTTRQDTIMQSYLSESEVTYDMSSGSYYQMM